ncbi:hypothetical protein Tco_0864126 [Tanacetum coccineum]
MFRLGPSVVRFVPLISAWRPTANIAKVLLSMIGGDIINRGGDYDLGSRNVIRAVGENVIRSELGGQNVIYGGENVIRDGDLEQDGENVIGDGDEECGGNNVNQPYEQDGGGTSIPLIGCRIFFSYESH